MNVTDLRTAVTLNGGTPASYDRIALLRQLVTAYGGTPTQYSIVGLLREAVTAAGGTPTQWSAVGIERELLAAMGATSASYDGRALSGLLAITPRAFFDFTVGSLPSGATLTRASAGRYINSSGSLASANNDVARFDYNPVSLALRGLLIEAGSTNLALASETMGDPVWSAVTGGTGAAVIVTANTGTAPDGAVTADRLQFARGAGATGGDYSLISQAVATSIGTAVVYSMWLRSNTGATQNVLIYLSSAGGLTIREFAVTTAWQRVELSVVPAATATAIAIGSRATFGGDAMLDLLGFGAQLEVGTVASAYIPTVGATVARSADAASLNWISRGVANGALNVRYTFDDGTSQDGSVTVAGGTATVPTNLSRARLRRVERR